MTETEFAAAFSFGIEAAAKDCDVLCLGEMGIANTTSAAALCCALFGGEATDWTGPGTGVTGEALAHKAALVAEGVACHRESLGDPLEALRRLGGHELAAIAGAVLAARMGRVPVILDGFVCTAAAAVLHAIDPAALDHCLVGHCSAEPGHRRLLEAIGKPPLLELGMRLGEGTGAALALGVLRAALNCHIGMATFDQAQVDGPA
jgi:nicotinate-nucleotide--dimethylbenzimidazole phosphoribosyltransferase